MRIRAGLLTGVLGITVAAGACSGGGKGSKDDPPTYWKDVAPIVNANCAGCHTEGGIGPFAFGTYQTAATLALSMKAVTEARTMPPSTIDNSGACGTWIDSRELVAKDVETIAAWVDGGSIEGDPADAPPAPTPLPTLSEVDASFDIGALYAPPDDTDEYRCFVVDPGIASAQYIVGYEVRPGNSEIVHHAVLFLPTSASAQTEAETLDTNDAGAGYTCFGSAHVPASVVATWAPGTGATFFAAGTGIAIPADRKVVVQIHYNTQSAVGSDQTEVDFDLEATVGKQAILLPYQATGFTLDPGEPAASVTNTVNVPVAGLIHAIYPHMHTRGRRLLVERIRGGTATCIADVPRWDFGWQQFFTASDPIQIAAGDQVRVTCTYDTQQDSTPILQGEATDEEMCFLGVYATP